MPVQRALPLLSSSHSFSEADRSVRQEIGRNNSIESFSEFLKSPSPVAILAKESHSGNKVKRQEPFIKMLYYWIQRNAILRMRFPDLHRLAFLI
jgi:hypothetical protein